MGKRGRGDLPATQTADGNAQHAVGLFLFYVLAVTIMVTIAPWTKTGAKVVARSPFVTVLQHPGIRDAAGIMNFVVVSAALSSMNTDVYLCSRMLFSLSRGGHAPRVLGNLSSRGSPVAAILASDFVRRKG